MTTTKRVELSFEGPVARIWLNRPEVRNAFDGAMVEELRRTLLDLRGFESARAIVIAGRGASFCAGADVSWMKAMAGYSRDENLREAQAMADLFWAVYESPKPIIARVHGAALGGGCGLVAACDIAVASEDSQFGFTEVRLGLLPAVISPYVLAKIGSGAARELFLTGERFDATRAREIGLVHHVVPAADLDAAVAARAIEIAKAGPSAVAAAKQLIRDIARDQIEAVQRTTVERIADIRVSDEGQEGMRAFLEKRKPTWIV
jgi:methylglutaconyl-CoA hydratase